MIMLQQAILHNNKGVHLLNAGNSYCAIRAFHIGYALMKEVAQAILENETHTKSPIDTDSWLSSFGQKSRTGLRLSGLEHSLCFVFDRPLLVDTDKVDSKELPAVSVTTILFNLGLACHQVGRLSGSEVPLRLASKYYNLVFRVICQSHMDHGVLGVLKCLALNNLAHLYYEGCDYRESQGCLECMVRHITQTGCLDSSSAHSFLSKADCDEIKLNFFHLVPPSTASAA
jgi:hypothetical protein